MRTHLHAIYLVFILFSLMGFSQPANDTCENALNINVTTTSQVIDFDLTEAAVNNESACDGDPLDEFVDVWYQFVMPITGSVYINGSVSVNGFNVYDSCNGTELACFNTNAYVENLIQGNTYLLRVRRWLPQNTGNNQSFSIYALAPFVGDTCSESENLTVNETLQTINFDIVNAEVNTEIGCEGEALDNYKDIWYNFTMPNSSDLEISGGVLNKFALYDTCNGSQIACFDGEGTDMPYIIDNLTPNLGYILRIFRDNLNNANNQSFTIRAISPSYPDCSNVEVLTVSTAIQTVNIDLTNPTYNYEIGCDGNDLGQFTDRWYEFTMPVDGNLYIKTSIRNRISILDSCGGTVLKCFDSSMETAEEDLLFLNKIIEGLNQGQTYIIRIFRPINETVTFIDEEFKIMAYERLSNDNCMSPEVITGLSSDNTSVSFALAGGNVTTDDTCEGEADFRIVEAFWQLTMPITGNLFIDTPNGNGISIYDACNGNEIFCNASEGSLESFKLISNVIEGNTYIIRCFNTERRIFEDEQQTLNLRVYERPVNDVCSNAETIPAITVNSQEVIFDTFGSVVNFEESCVGLPEEDLVDVWFEFTMPNFTYLNFESYQFNFFAIYDACNGNEIHCFAGNEIVQGLIPNQTYTLRVFQRQTEMFHPFKTFNMYASETLSIVNITPQKTQLKMIGEQELLVSQLSTKANLSVYNLLGQRVVISELRPATEQRIRLDVKSGIYIAHLDTGTDIETLKLIVR